MEVNDLYTVKRNDNRMIYLLIFIIVLLLIVAGAVIFYLFSKVNNMQDVAAKRPQVKVERKLVVAEPVKKPVRAPEPATPTQAAPEPRTNKLATEDIATIVQMVMSQMQKTQKTDKPTKSEVEKLLKKETSAPAKDEMDDLFKEDELGESPATPSGSTDATDDIDSVINALGGMDVDTLEEKEQAIPDIQEETLVRAKKGKDSARAADNFNKVVVQSSGADEFSQLDTQLEQITQDNETNNYDKEAVKEVRERKNEMRTIVVKKGDTLMSIAKKAYGSSKKYAKILRANPGIIKNPDRIFIGQVLRVPK